MKELKKILSFTLIAMLVFAMLPADKAYAATPKVKVTWNANGGKIGTKAKVTVKIVKGKKIGKLPKTPVRKGYAFKGWYTKKSGGKAITKNTKVKKNVTFYAQWKAAAPAVPKEVSIKLKSGYMFLPLTGGTCTLTATIKPSDATQQTAITWSSDKVSVATVDQSGKVTAKGVGDATISATTANGKKGTFRVRVGADVSSLSFNTGTSSGNVSYDLKAGDKIPMYLPKIAPQNAYSLLNFASSNTGVADVVAESDGTFSIKTKAAGTATITAKSHNGKTDSFTVKVKPALTNAQIASTRTMQVNTYWNNIPITLTPASGAYEDYILTATEPNSTKASTVLRIEQNKNAYAISPGQARIRVSINGVEKSSCLVTVSGPPQQALSSYSLSNPGLKYYNVEYESMGKATVSLGVVPINGASYYWITEHGNYNLSMNDTQLFQTNNITNLGGGALRVGNVVKTPNTSFGTSKRSWQVSAAEIAQGLKFTGVDTGLRFYSIAPYNASNVQITSNVFVGRVPVLHYPRNVGGPPGNGSNADGVMVAFTIPMYFPSVGNFMLGGDMWLSSGFGSIYYIPTAPWALGVTFDRIQGADGYEIDIVHNGQYLGYLESSAGEIKPIVNNRMEWVSDFIFDNGETIAYIFPYVKDVDGTRSYGEMRTVIYNVQIGGNMSTKYWENAATIVSPILQHNWK